MNYACFILLRDFYAIYDYELISFKNYDEACVPKPDYGLRTKFRCNVKDIMLNHYLTVLDYVICDIPLFMMLL